MTVDTGALFRVKNARDALHGEGAARDRLVHAWLQLLPPKPEDFPDPGRYELMLAAVTRVEDPEAGSLRATVGSMDDKGVRIGGRPQRLPVGLAASVGTVGRSAENAGVG